MVNTRFLVVSAVLLRAPTLGAQPLDPPGPAPVAAPAAPLPNRANEYMPSWLRVGLAGEYNFASGDSDPADGRRGTFDQLYPTGHEKYGLADQVGWRNIHHLRAGVDVTPTTALLVTLNYHSWWLADRNDALYSAGSAVIARAAGGAAARHVGQEIDIQASRAITAQLQLPGGYAYVFPGAFLKDPPRRRLWLPVRDGNVRVSRGPMSRRRRR